MSLALEALACLLVIGLSVAYLRWFVRLYVEWTNDG